METSKIMSQILILYHQTQYTDGKLRLTASEWITRSLISGQWQSPAMTQVSLPLSANFKLSVHENPLRDIWSPLVPEPWQPTLFNTLSGNCDAALEASSTSHHPSLFRRAKLDSLHLAVSGSLIGHKDSLGYATLEVAQQIIYYIYMYGSMCVYNQITVLHLKLTYLTSQHTSIKTLKWLQFA